MDKDTPANALVHETSPYLRQHARNPVRWYPWGKKALELAARENKLIVVSIGYSSCHWCHVMAHESFEDESVARLMNEHFINIKVDREERPDIDHIYMSAVQMINNQGGWPLNCIALPDGRPIWGGTYFPRELWMDALSRVHQFYMENPDKIREYAEELAGGIIRNSLAVPTLPGGGKKKTDFRSIVKSWSVRFDTEHGGQKGSPKFPMPVTLRFLLEFGYRFSNEQVLSHVETTLKKMAGGGIYDQVGGGFSRYSVDDRWKVPHFEKMLYDNAQLVTLYSEAYQVFGLDIFRRVARQTVGFMKRELLSPEGLFHAALDADSEGVEGKYYTWSREELEELLGASFGLFAEYYRIEPGEVWQDGCYILHPGHGAEEFADRKGIGREVFLETLSSWQRILLEARQKRIPPGLDDKSLTAWNSLAISGLVAAYRAFGEKEDLRLAIQVGEKILENCRMENGMLYRNYAGGKASIRGFHGDHALFIAACIDLYQASHQKRWLDLALEMTGLVTDRFYDEAAGYYLYNDKEAGYLVTNHAEIQDNVIPSSNAAMAHSLFILHHLTGERKYGERSAGMAGGVAEDFARYPMAFAGWGSLLLKQEEPFYEIAVTGKGAHSVTSRLMKDYLPHAVVAATDSESDLPLFKNRFAADKNLIFVCRDSVCRNPVEKISDAKEIYRIS